MCECYLKSFPTTNGIKASTVTKKKNSIRDNGLMGKCLLVGTMYRMRKTIMSALSMVE